MFYVYFNNKRDLDLGIKAIKRPSIPVQKKKFKTITVEGRDGDIYIDQDCYEDITISVDFNFVDRTNFQAKCRMVKQWLNKIKNNELKFSDDLGVFYKVKKVEVEDIERIYKVKGNFTVAFTCNPYTWLSEGKQQIILNTTTKITNEFELSKPTWILTGEGLVTLKVNGNTVTVNVGQKVEINTELELCFKDSSLINLALQTGEFKDLFLKEGLNTIEYSIGTGGTLTDIKLIPNWKTF